MARLKKRSVLQGLVLFIVCVASALIGFALRNNYASTPESDRLSVIQQSDEKVIEIKEFPGKPFDLSDLSVRKVKIQPGEKLKVRSVAESEEWLDGLEFNIKNKWDKQIIFIKIDLEFPETWLAGRPLMIDHLIIGIHPQGTTNDKKYGKPLALNPGETYTYSHSKHRLTLTKKFLEQGGFQLANLNKAVIKVSAIIFDDGTQWGEGNWFKYNPNVPGGYEQIRK